MFFSGFGSPSKEIGTDVTVAAVPPVRTVRTLVTRSIKLRRTVAARKQSSAAKLNETATR